jgi:hypothetical protein
MSVCLNLHSSIIISCVSFNHSICLSINQSNVQNVFSYLILGLLKKVGFVKREGPDGGLSLNDSDLIV